MELKYQNGQLEPGIYELELNYVEREFCYNEHRKWLFEGIKLAIADLQKIGCIYIYLDGSYVTKKILPKDFDLCWDESNIDLVASSRVCPELFDPGWKFEKFKSRYRGDVAPANSIADQDRGINYLGYFMEDRQGRDKGIVKIFIGKT